MLFQDIKTWTKSTAGITERHKWTEDIIQMVTYKY